MLAHGFKYIAILGSAFRYLYLRYSYEARNLYGSCEHQSSDEGPAPLIRAEKTAMNSERKLEKRDSARLKGDFLKKPLTGHRNSALACLPSCHWRGLLWLEYFDKDLEHWSRFAVRPICEI